MNDSDKLKAMYEAVREQDPSLFKVHYTLPVPQGSRGGEYFYAKKLADGTFQLNNIPFFATNLGIDDIVKTKDVGDKNEYNAPEITKIVRKGSKTVLIHIGQLTKHTLPADAKKVIRSVWQYLESNKVRYEHGFAGYAAVALPLEMTDAEFRKLLLDSPEPFVVVDKFDLSGCKCAKCGKAFK